MEALIDELSMLPASGGVLCALSGGADSVCLLHGLRPLCERRGLPLFAAHYHHGIRGAEADRDEAFVRQLCQSWNIPLTVGHGNVPAQAAETGTGLEETARALRYQFLEQTAREQSCTVIATAHNADDNAETLLFHLLRGTGIRGLTGIPPVRGAFIRPLLTTTRQEIEAYLSAHQLPHIEDSTNADTTYARNRLRHQVLPILRQLNPQAVQHMGSTARQLAVLNGDLDQAAQVLTAQAGILPGQVSLPLDDLFTAPESVRFRVLQQLLEQLGRGSRDIGTIHLQSILTLAARGREGSTLSLPHGITACISGGQLLFQCSTAPTQTLALLPAEPVQWGRFTLTLLDAPKGPGLCLRPGRAQDQLSVAPCPPARRLTLPGSRGARSIKRLCLDKGISLAEREQLPAILVNGTLAAVWQLGTDIHFLGEQGSSCRFIQIIQKTGDDHNDQRNA